MPSFNVKRIREDDTGGVDSPVGPTGTVMTSKRMLGEDGAGAVGFSSWHRCDGLWKTFFLYAQDRLAATGVGGAVVEVHACMELPAQAGNSDGAAYKLLATLTGAAPSFSTEEPWRWVRVEVTTAAAFAVQVGYHEQGQ